MADMPSMPIGTAAINWFDGNHRLHMRIYSTDGYNVIERCNDGSGWTTALDIAFAVVVGLMLLARWYELRSGLGQDGYGKPATLAAFPKYAAWTVTVSLVLWAGANALGNHVLG